MSAKKASKGVRSYEPPHKGGIMPIFLACVGIFASFIGEVLVLDRSDQVEGQQSVTAGGDALESLLGTPVAYIAFAFGGLAIVVALYRLRHFRASKKALFNIVAVAVGAWAVVMAHGVYSSVK